MFKKSLIKNRKIDEIIKRKKEPLSQKIPLPIYPGRHLHVWSTQTACK